MAYQCSSLLQRCIRLFLTRTFATAFCLLLAFASLAGAQTRTTLSNSPGFSADTALLPTDGIGVGRQMARSGLDAGERVRLAPDSLGSHGNGAWPSLATLFSGHSLLFFTATPGTGSITFSGDSVPEGGLGYVDLTVNGVVSCEVLYQQGDLPWDFAHRLATAINNGCTTLISASVDSFYMGASEVPMVMTATTSGASTNYSFSIAYRPGDDPFFTLTPSGSTLTGGHN